MSVLVSTATRVLTQGITGATGQLHTRLCREYGSQMVAGVTPGRGGTDFEGIPILHWPGVITPGQLGPISRVALSSSARFTRTMSSTGTPSVMHTTSGMPASAASRIASAAPAGGT